jgi:hypothetical protein
MNLPRTHSASNFWSDQANVKYLVNNTVNLAVNNSNDMERSYRYNASLRRVDEQGSGELLANSRGKKTMGCGNGKKLKDITNNIFRFSLQDCCKKAKVFHNCQVLNRKLDFVPKSGKIFESW